MTLGEFRKMTADLPASAEIFSEWHWGATELYVSTQECADDPDGDTFQDLEYFGEDMSNVKRIAVK